MLVTIPLATPCGETDAQFISPMPSGGDDDNDQSTNDGSGIHVVPILRAGLVLLEQSSSVLPVSVTHHLGFVRDEETLQPTMYLNKVRNITIYNY